MSLDTLFANLRTACRISSARLASTPVRIVRMAINAVWNTIAIAIPATTVQTPSTVMLDPAMGLILVSVARLDPYTAYPHVAMTTPIPITGNPNVTATRFRQAFKTWRRRCHLHIYANGSRTCLRNRDGTEGAHRQQQSWQYFARELGVKHDRSLHKRHHTSRFSDDWWQVIAHLHNAGGGTWFTNSTDRNLYPVVTTVNRESTMMTRTRYLVVHASKSSLLTSNFTEVGAALALISRSAL